MALDARKRQKKVERRHAKQKAKRRVLGRRAASGLAARIEKAASAPILHCGSTDALWNVGMGNVLLSRQLAYGRVAFGAFLVDACCLGVKNAWSSVMPRSEYEESVYGSILETFPFVETTPEFARTVVEGAVDYARDLGFEPHPDYRAARMIFGQIDPEACSEEFRYGRNGKPFFVAGPDDSPFRCESVIAQLAHYCGPDGFDYFVPFDLQSDAFEADDEEYVDEDGTLVLLSEYDEQFDERLGFPPGSLARAYLQYVAEHDDAAGRPTVGESGCASPRGPLRNVLRSFSARFGLWQR
jgi:hypothetical protein